MKVSPEIEARIIAKANQSGVSVDDYLDQVVGENEEYSAIVSKFESSATQLSPDALEAKFKRGLAQYERGEFVDGEPFMQDLLRGMDDDDAPPRSS